MSVEEILAALQAILDGANQQDGTQRSLTDEEVARYEELEGELKRAQKTEELIKRQAAWKSVKVNVPVTGAAPAEGDDINRAFDSYLRTGRVDSDVIARAQGEATGSAGGYLVPEGFRNMMVEKRKAFGGVADNCETISTDSGNPLPWPLNDDTANLGGIVAEGAVVTTNPNADLVLSTRALGAYKYGSGGASNLPLKVSWELAQDSAFDLQGFVARKLGERIARAQAADWVVGTGAGEPQGLLSDQGGITAATAFSSNTAPTYDDFVSVVHDLDPAYREGAVWVFNDAWLEVIRKMDDGTRPLFWGLNNSNIGDALGGATLLGFPVIIDQACPSPSASNHFGFFGNLREAYVIRRVKATTMVTLNELYAVNGQIGYLAWERADGMVQDPNAGVLLTAAA